MKNKHTFFNTNIAKKLLLLSSISVIVFFLVILLLFKNQSTNIFFEYITEDISNDTNIVTHEAEIILNDLEKDLLFIAQTPPILGIDRAKKNNGIDPIDNSTLESWKKRLATIFLSIASSKEEYSQIRLLDVNGIELVRVNSYDGDAYIVEEKNLQDKSNRDYFSAINLLHDGSVYFDISLNREGPDQAIEQPLNPVIRIAVPLFNNEQERIGSIISNISFERITEIIQATKEPMRQRFIVGFDGEYYFGPEADQLWGGEKNLNHGANIKNDIPEIADMITYQQEEVIQTDEYFFSSHPTRTTSSNQIAFFIVNQAPVSLALAPFNQLLRNSLLIGLLFILIIFLFTYLGIRQLTAPLSRIISTTKAFAHGNLSERILINSDDEFGKLATSFNYMADQLQHLIQNMEGEVKKRTADLQTASERLRLATTSAGIGVWQWNIQKDQMFWDNQMFKLYGVPFQKNLNAEFWQNLLDPKDAKRVMKNVEKALRSQSDFEEKFRVIWPDKSVHHMHVRATVIRDEKGRPAKMVGVNLDITKEAEVDQAKTEFVSLASHQMKTPLTAINWSIQALESDPKLRLTKDQRELVNGIRESNQKMIKLISGLLNISRLELGTFSVNPELINVRPIVKQTINELSDLAKSKKLEVKTSFQAKLPQIKADPNLLSIVLQNLISNAIKYTPEKGSVKIRVEADKQNMYFSISDTGYGISEDDQKELFNKLFRSEDVKEKGIEGTGLGLYIVKSIMDATGGKVSFESELNKGTTFYFNIPLKGMKKKKGTRVLSTSF